MRRSLLLLLLLLLFTPLPVLPQGLEPAKGVLLVASDQIRDGRFHHAVILLLRHGDGGSVGVLLNQPTPIELADLLPEQDRPHLESLHLFSGGPVEPMILSVLWGGEDPPQGAVEVIPGLAISGPEQMFLGLAMGELEADSYRVFAGYCGWAPGQLEFELRRGDWSVTPVGNVPLLQIEPEALWGRFRLTSGGTLI